MSFNKTLTALSTLALALGVSACAHNQQQAQTPPPQTDEQKAVSNLDSERTAYIAATQAKIDEYQKFADDLKTKADAKPKSQAKKMQNASEDMTSLLADVKKSLNDVKTAQTQDWIDNKRDVEKSLARAETQYSNSVTLLK